MWRGCWLKHECLFVESEIFWMSIKSTLFHWCVCVCSGWRGFFHFYSADIHLHLFCVSRFNNLRFYTWCCWSGWTFGIPCLPLPPCCYNYGAYTDVTVERSAVLFLMWTAFSGYDRSHTTPKVADYVSYALSVVQFLFCFRVPQRAPRLTHQVAPCGGWRRCLGARGVVTNWTSSLATS